jgi:O-antigen/teichoic acid export membrane protein
MKIEETAVRFLTVSIGVLILLCMIAMMWASINSTTVAIAGCFILMAILCIIIAKFHQDKTIVITAAFILFFVLVLFICLFIKAIVEDAKGL